MRTLSAVAGALALLAAGLTPAMTASKETREPPPEAATSTSAPAAPAEDTSWQDRLVQRTGVIALPQAKASLNLGEDYYFLDAADSQKVLVDGWRNPPEAVSDVLGMIFPKRFKPLDDGAWGAVVTYEQTGYVSDKDAKDADYAKLLADLRKGEEASNAERTKAGYSAIHLAGWAETPAYDATHHTVVWAKDLAIGGNPAHTLNYDIRVLGRRGVLSLNVVSALSDLPEVRSAAQRIGQIAVYDPGERYADYHKGDAKAAYGVAGLIAAGVGAAALKKVGLLAVLLAFGKKGIVLIGAALAAAGAWLRRLFGGKPKTEPVVAGSAPPPDTPPTGGDIVS